MKTKKTRFVFVLIAAILVCLIMGACNRDNNPPGTFVMDRDTSYAIGMYIASQFHIPDVRYDYNALMEGFRAFNEAGETRFSMDRAIQIITTAFERLAEVEDERDRVEGERNIEIGREFLAQNSRRPGVTTTASGLQYEVIREGTGERPTSDDFVSVHYEGTLIDGTVFDSSLQRGVPAEFPLFAVIDGWTEGLQLMTEGSIYRLYLPSELGYGSMNMGAIPPHSTLIFQVELLEILR
jgi:FKBP-type peptidyl-prolyl cis-trans isomerase